MTKKTAPGLSRGVKREIVVAPPGCGKTDKLTARLIEAVTSEPQQSVLCITFTENAASEMKARAMKALPKGMTLSRSQRICTLHSYCWNKLHQEAQNEGRSLHVIDNGYLNKFSKKSGLDAFNRGFDYNGEEYHEIRLEQVVRAAAFLRQGKEISFESWRAEAWQEKFKEYIDKYVKFKDYLNNRSDGAQYLDFNDILQEADQKISNGSWTERFDVVLVDEVQDMSDFQLNIIERLVDDNGAICFFGDPEQAIYSFMGANVRKLHSLWLSCDEVNRHSFRINYRSPAHILRIINKYAHNRFRVDKMWPGFNMEWEQKPSRAMARIPVPDYGGLELTHSKDLDEDIALYHASSIKQEVWKISQLIDSFDSGESNAILALHNNRVGEIIALLKKKRKYVILGGNDDEHTYLPRLMRAFSHLCRYPDELPDDDKQEPFGGEDENPWICMLPFLIKKKKKKVSDTKEEDSDTKGEDSDINERISNMIRTLEKHGVTPLDIILGRRDSTLEGDSDLQSKDFQKLLRFGPLFLDCRKRLLRLQNYPEEDLNTQLGNWLAYCHKHLVGSSLLSAYQITQWDTILRRIKKELKHAAPTGLDERLDLVESVLSGIRPKDMIPCYGSDRRQVHVMTVHKAKGLSFDNVFMCSSSRSFWDYSGSSEADRVFFVGITRARRRLVISYSDPTPTEEDLVNGRKPKSRLKDMSFIKDPLKDMEKEGSF